MLRALFFDMGGTLDGDGVHWLDRFASAYEACSISLARETLRAVFDAAEMRAASDDEMPFSGLESMVQRHVGWQLERLRTDGGAVAELNRADEALGGRVHQRMVKAFVDPIVQIGARNARLLSDLRSKGFFLGVVSNGCGNVELLCEELGYAPFLSLVVDSRRVGVEKPDPAIYRYAAERAGLHPSSIMMIGDSFDRDIRPAASLGMRTAWLQGPNGGACPDPSLADICLTTLTELPLALDRRAQTVA